MAFRGPTLPVDRQRELFRRWSTDPEVHPHEAFVGLAALLHGATTQELQHLTDEDDRPPVTPHPVGSSTAPTPLDPWTWTALQRCLGHREDIGQQQLPHADHHADQGHPRRQRPTATSSTPCARSASNPASCAPPGWSTSSAPSTRSSSPPPTACATRPSSPTSPITSTPHACRTRELQAPPRTGSRELCALAKFWMRGAHRNPKPWCQRCVLRGLRRTQGLPEVGQHRVATSGRPDSASSTCSATASATPRKSTGTELAKDLKPIYTAPANRPPSMRSSR